MSQLRIVKLVVLPVAMVDDGEHLTEVKVEALEVPANEIRDFAGENSDLRRSLESMAKSLGVEFDLFED